MPLALHGSSAQKPRKLPAETESIEYDLEYLRNWSLGLDLQIMARTFKAVLLRRNAY